MRGSHKEMIEIIDSFEKEGLYFVQIALYFGDAKNHYQFGVQKSGYNTVKRIFQFRPFDPASHSKYRYFWNYGHGRNDDGYFLDIRFEQDKNGKSYPIRADEGLGSNLRWFIEIKDKKEIEHLQTKI